VKSLIRSWLGVPDDVQRGDQATLREVLDALDKMEPERARYLARFAYLLGRVAQADQQVGPEETRTMEHILQQEGHLPADQAALVVGLAKTSNLLFGGTDNYVVAREFEMQATPAQKLELLRCLFAVSVAEDGMSIAEEREIQRIARELRIDSPDVVALRLEFKKYLPGLMHRSRS
jgi:uncharacterized tellurite resistance protein B-like protein